MSVPQVGDCFDGIETRVLRQRVRNDLQRLGEGSEAVLLHAGEAARVLHEFQTHFRFRRAAAGDQSASLDQTTDDAEGVVKRAIRLVENEFVGTAKKDGNGLAGSGRSDAGYLRKG